MNEKNALNQLALSEETSRLRREQFQALGDTLVSYNHEPSVKAAVTFGNLAMLLISSSNQLEDLIIREIDQAKSNMQRMRDLPDDEQWEYRIAYTLGVTEALNKIGSLQNQLREHTQTALHKASLLALSANGKSALPAHKAGLADTIHAIEEEANTRQNKRMKDIGRLGLSIAQVFHKDALEHESAQPLTIASVCSTASDLTTSSLLVALGNIATELLNSKLPVKDETKEQWFTAQATASGIIGGLITELVQKHEPWLAISLN
ncbi:hypothetical protein BH11CYA1_BH11CYA1_09520 [soil metagenome]